MAPFSPGDHCQVLVRHRRGRVLPQQRPRPEDEPVGQVRGPQGRQLPREGAEGRRGADRPVPQPGQLHEHGGAAEAAGRLHGGLHRGGDAGGAPAAQLALPLPSGEPAQAAARRRAAAGAPPRAAGGPGRGGASQVWWGLICRGHPLHFPRQTGPGQRAVVWAAVGVPDRGAGIVDRLGAGAPAALLQGPQRAADAAAGRGVGAESPFFPRR